MKQVELEVEDVEQLIRESYPNNEKIEIEWNVGTSLVGCLVTLNECRRGPAGGPRKGSVRYLLSKMDVGDVIWFPDNPEKTASNRPPVRADKSLRQMGKFSFTKYLAVPQTSKTVEPECLWKIERKA